MIIALIILFLLVLGICILWVRGIDHMYKYHRDYSGYDLFDEENTHNNKDK